METIKMMMKDSIFEVFEKMFFIFLEENSDVPEVAYEKEATIDFTSTVSGRMKLCFSGDVLREMTRNMLVLAEDEEISDDMMADCGKEAVNMTCGNFLTKIDSSEKFSISVPVFSEGIVHRVGAEACRVDFASPHGSVGLVIDTGRH